MSGFPEVSIILCINGPSNKAGSKQLADYLIVLVKVCKLIWLDWKVLGSSPITGFGERAEHNKRWFFPHSFICSEKEPSTAVLVVLLDASFLSPIQSVMKESLRQRTQL